MVDASLEILARRIRACRICRDTPERAPLPHEPRPVLQESGTARILIAGQAPGTRVHASGKPFTDPSGVRLRDWMGIGEDIFYDASKIAVAPMGFCFPGLDAKGSDLPPRIECAKAWRQSLMDAMPQIGLVLAIGIYAQRWHIPGSTSLAETVHNWRSGLEKTPRIIALPHPSWRNSGWLKANPWFASELLPRLRAEVQRSLGDP
jgi:uracil-DNA glycosylase